MSVMTPDIEFVSDVRHVRTARTGVEFISYLLTQLDQVSLVHYSVPMTVGEVSKGIGPGERPPMVRN